MRFDEALVACRLRLPCRDFALTFRAAQIVEVSRRGIMNYDRWFRGVSLAQALSTARRLGCRIKNCDGNGDIVVCHEGFCRSVRMNGRWKECTARFPDVYAGLQSRMRKSVL